MRYDRALLAVAAEAESWLNAWRTDHQPT